MRFCTGRRETEQRDNQSYAKLNSIQNGSQSTLNQLQAEPLPIGAHFAVKRYACTLRTFTIIHFQPPLFVLHFAVAARSELSAAEVFCNTFLFYNDIYKLFANWAYLFNLAITVQKPKCIIPKLFGCAYCHTVVHCIDFKIYAVVKQIKNIIQFHLNHILSLWFQT